MKTENKKLNKIHNIEKFFIMAGLFEIFALIFMLQNLYLMIIGVITITPAYLAFKEGKIKANYFTGAWALLKYVASLTLHLAFPKVEQYDNQTPF